MQYAIELFFNEEMEKQLFRYAQRIAEEKLSTKFLEYKARPHVTLACFNDVSEKEGIEIIKFIAQKYSAIPVCIGSLGMFTDTKTIFAYPVMKSSMYEMHRDIHEYFRGSDTRGWEWYLPDVWVPHCALAIMHEDEEESFYKACDLVLREFEKSNGKFSAIGLVKITLPAEETFVAELKGV
ncbi:MAG: 2'-5' RNA ligase family protein [Clostridiales bacterium]|nr:2'-5' RNA ligase family protein [Clostridiales bacterium]